MCRGGGEAAGWSNSWCWKGAGALGGRLCIGFDSRPQPCLRKHLPVCECAWRTPSHSSRLCPWRAMTTPTLFIIGRQGAPCLEQGQEPKQQTEQRAGSAVVHSFTHHCRSRRTPWASPQKLKVGPHACASSSCSWAGMCVMRWCAAHRPTGLPISNGRTRACGGSSSCPSSAWPHTGAPWP